VDFPGLLLNDALRQLAGNADERAPCLAPVIAEPQVALAPPAEKYGCSTVVAFGHVGIPPFINDDSGPACSTLFFVSLASLFMECGRLAAAWLCSFARGGSWWKGGVEPQQSKALRAGS